MHARTSLRRAPSQLASPRTCAWGCVGEIQNRQSIDRSYPTSQDPSKLPKSEWKTTYISTYICTPSGQTTVFCPTQLHNTHCSFIVHTCMSILIFAAIVLWGSTSCVCGKQWKKHLVRLTVVIRFNESYFIHDFFLFPRVPRSCGGHVWCVCEGWGESEGVAAKTRLTHPRPPGAARQTAHDRRGVIIIVNGFWHVGYIDVLRWPAQLHCLATL